MLSRARNESKPFLWKVDSFWFTCRLLLAYQSRISYSYRPTFEVPSSCLQNGCSVLWLDALVLVKGVREGEVVFMLMPRISCLCRLLCPYVANSPDTASAVWAVLYSALAAETVVSYTTRKVSPTCHRPHSFTCLFRPVARSCYTNGPRVYSTTAVCLKTTPGEMPHGAPDRLLGWRVV